VVWKSAEKNAKGVIRKEKNNRGRKQLSWRKCDEGVTEWEQYPKVEDEQQT